MTTGAGHAGLTEGQAALRRLRALGAAIVALILAGVGMLLFDGSRELDALKASEERVLAQAVLDRAQSRLVGDMTSVTVWDQAFATFRPGGEIVWADKEVGTFFANNRGEDRTVGIDGQGRPFYAWVGESRVDPASQAAFLAAVRPMIARARAVEARRAAHAPHVMPTASALSETAAGFVVFEGVPYVVAASTVTPEEADAPRPPGPGVMLVAAQRVDGQVLQALRQLNLPGARLDLKGPPTATSVQILDLNGRRIGQLAWTPRHPGLEALMHAAPALALGFTVAALMVGALGWQIRRVARRLEMHEQAHADALRDLKEARDRAEAANVAKSQFLANMSHEIRTPLNGVLGMAQVLARSHLAPADQEKVQVIRASGEALLSLLNDLLDLSKIEAGRMEVDVHDFDLEAAVADATRAFATLAAQKDVAFLIEVQPEARGLWRGDGGKIRQVLANLASNAVKFTSAGEVRVAVRRVAGGVACTVSDTGAGIARDRLDGLFQRFSQVDPTATRKFGGTGLGLAISRELVELMGGGVAVTSVEGRGSAFSFDLPLDWVGPVRAASADDSAEAELPPIRILAAEDNKTNQLLLTAMLEPMGVDVRLTADGREAVDVFAAQPFDLVLMDVQMPVMNGVDATRAIRALEAERGLAPTPILALSANVMRHQIDDYLAAGMNGFVAKPIEMAALIGAIEDALAGRQEAAAA